MPCPKEHVRYSTGTQTPRQRVASSWHGTAQHQNSKSGFVYLTVLAFLVVARCFVGRATASGAAASVAVASAALMSEGAGATAGSVACGQHVDGAGAGGKGCGTFLSVEEYYLALGVAVIQAV